VPRTGFRMGSRAIDDLKAGTEPRHYDRIPTSTSWKVWPCGAW
jgi:hypothetical protein